MFRVKVHERGARKVLAVCDEGLLGKVLKGRGIELDLARYRGFYEGKLVGEEELIQILAEWKNFESINLVGKRCVMLAIKQGLVSKNDAIALGEELHVQIYML